MAGFRYVIADVFTDTPLAGNGAGGAGTACAEEQTERARKEQTAAEEHRQQAREIDPDVDE